MTKMLRISSAVFLSASIGQESMFLVLDICVGDAMTAMNNLFWTLLSFIKHLNFPFSHNVCIQVFYCNV
jgi:hypothetical protein